jgi:hypothetical protein
VYEIEPKQAAGQWAMFIYSKSTRRFYEWLNEQDLQEMLEHHRQLGNTVENGRAPGRLPLALRGSTAARPRP